MNVRPNQAEARPVVARSISSARIVRRGPIFWHGVPIYRELLARNFNQAEPAVRLWALLAIVLIQTGYWLRYLRRATPSLPRQVFIGHVLMFLARLNFIFTSGVFSAVFFVRFDQVKFSLSSTGLLLVVLFSMFCVSLDVERIGAAFLKGEDLPH